MTKAASHRQPLELDSDQALRAFIAASRQPLERLRLAARVRLLRALDNRVPPAEGTGHLTKDDSARIAEAYAAWSEQQGVSETICPERFAEQTAFVCFVQILFARVLEDRGIRQPRLASKAGRLYQHFYPGPIFDWFVPEEELCKQTKEFLGSYDLRSINGDLLGFTYEAYADQPTRKRKGHFLTRPDVVDYMLDLLGYDGQQVLGKRLLDPACGSGSFLIHAACRYRRALLSALCAKHSLPDNEDAIEANPALRLALARRFLHALTTLFYGMELSPFACYLAEMNLLIQGVDDLAVLLRAQDSADITRFRILNTDSLELPCDILNSADFIQKQKIGASTVRLNALRLRESSPIKAQHAALPLSFSYVIFNPPYVTGKREDLTKIARLTQSAFFADALSGDTNLYLLFLKLGLYYLADQGRLGVIVPLTLFGDRSASGARTLLRTAPFTLKAITRFYRGDGLFPGVDQAVGIVRVDRKRAGETMTVSGGNSVAEARANALTVPVASVIDAVPASAPWNGAWLVGNTDSCQALWQQARAVSGDFTFTLGDLLLPLFDMRQGDINATHLRPLLVTGNRGDYAYGHVAIYKGEDVASYAPLPWKPSEWACTTVASHHTLPQTARAAWAALTQLQQAQGEQVGIVLRAVARLNTRARLTATWYRREARWPLAFSHSLWRLALRENNGKEGGDEEKGQALLVLLNSNTFAYLINLFASNNNISREEMLRVPTPDPATFPLARLADLANRLLQERARWETECENGMVTRSPSAVSESAAYARHHENDENGDRFVALQREADEAVADWYGFTPAMQATITEGLPWARRQQAVP